MARIRLQRVNRLVHRWGAIVVALPVLVIVASGILLQLKKESDWIQPATRSGVGTEPVISFEQILRAARTIEGAAIQSWDDVERVDVRPERGVIKVRAKNRWEVQIDAQTADVLQVAYRRSDLIESIHDGSFFAGFAKLWIFLPTGIVLLALWVTGLVLFVRPYQARAKARRLRAEGCSVGSSTH